MSDLPASWEWATMDELASKAPNALAIGPFGSNLKVSDYRLDGVPLVFVRHIRARNFDGLDAKFVDEDKARSLSSHVVRPGDILVTKMGEPPGDACVYRGQSQAVITADCIKLTAHESLSPDYLAYLIEAPQFRSAVRTITQGVAQKKVSLGRFRKLSLPIAPAGEQERVVAAVEASLSRLDAASASLRSATRRLAALANQAADEAFRRFDERLPLSEVAEVRGGIQKQPKRRPKDNRAPFLRVANVGHGTLNLSDVHEIELFEGELKRYRLQSGDLLVVEGNGSPAQIGRSAVWDSSIPNCVHQNHLIRVRPGPTLDAAFLGLYWNAPSTRSRLTELASSTSGLYTLSTAKVKRIQVPVASLAEQADTVSRLAAQAEVIGRLRMAVVLASARQGSLRRSILSAAFSGQLVPQDPDDEPASALLDRVRTDREASTPAKRSRKVKAS